VTGRLARWRTRAGVQVAAIGLVVLGLGLLTAGCGGSGSTTSTTSQAARETAFLSYAQCMRAHGIPVSDPTVGANGIVRLPRPSFFGAGQSPTAAQLAQLQQARSACQGDLKGITFGFNPASNPQFQAALLKYAQCMRANGYNMPDPTFTTPTTTSPPTPGTFRGPFGAINRSDPAFQKANTACRSILQAAGFGFRGGTGTGTAAPAAGSS